MPGAPDRAAPEQRIDRQRQRGRERQQAERHTAAAALRTYGNSCVLKRRRINARQRLAAPGHNRGTAPDRRSRWRALNTVESQRFTAAAGAASSRTMRPPGGEVRGHRRERRAQRVWIENVLKHGHAQHQIELFADIEGRQIPHSEAAAPGQHPRPRRAAGPRAIIVGLKIHAQSRWRRAPPAGGSNGPTPQPTSNTRVPVPTFSQGSSASRCSR